MRFKALAGVSRMRNPMWTGLIITCCTLSIVGQPYPDFVLPRIDNNLPLKLSDYRGRKVLLVHFASW
jgi:hypothetical protein